MFSWKDDRSSDVAHQTPEVMKIGEPKRGDGLAHRWFDWFERGAEAEARKRPAPTKRRRQSG